MQSIRCTRYFTAQKIKPGTSSLTYFFSKIIPVQATTPLQNSMDSYHLVLETNKLLYITLLHSIVGNMVCHLHLKLYFVFVP